MITFLLLLSVGYIVSSSKLGSADFWELFDRGHKVVHENLLGRLTSFTGVLPTNKMALSVIKGILPTPNNS